MSTERVRQGGHNIPEELIRRRFAVGLRNFHEAYNSSVDAWTLFDHVGEAPVLLDALRRSAAAARKVAI